MGLLWATCLHAQELIPYRSGELWGYCTPDKKIVIEPQFEFASWFYEGLARVANHCDYDCYDVYDGKGAILIQKVISSFLLSMMTALIL